MHAAIWKYRLVSRRKACGNKGVVGAVLLLGLFSQDWRNDLVVVGQELFHRLPYAHAS